MTWVLAALLVLWVAFGPVVLVLAAALLGVPRVRWWAQDHWTFTRRDGGRAAAAALVVAAVVVVVPDGRLPVPPGPGLVAAPSYVGRPATESPITVAAAPQHPYLAVAGRDPGHDARAGHTSPVAGPLGLQPEVDTGWFGLEHCPRPAFDSSDRIVVACEDRSGPAVHVVDPATMRKLASRDLPEVDADERPGGDACAATPYFMDAQDRAVLATADRHLLALRTADGRGDAELSVDQEWDLKPFVPHGDCLVALLPDWSGRLWWASLGGLVGTVVPETGEVRVHDLGEDVAGSFAVDETGVYVATVGAVHRLAAGPDGAPQPAWRAPYDSGSDPHGPTALSGTTPTLLDGGVVAVTDRVDGRSEVLFLDGTSGAEICRQPVFEEDEGTASGSLVSLGTGVVVTNQDGYSGPRSALLGLTTGGGLARVDLTDGKCRVRWTNDRVVALSAVATVSLPTGLVHTYTKRPTWTGVSAWYATALDAGTGRAMWSVRTGTGALRNDDHAAMTIGPDGSLWTATLGGLVRVRDRDRRPTGTAVGEPRGRVTASAGRPSAR